MSFEKMVCAVFALAMISWGLSGIYTTRRSGEQIRRYNETVVTAAQVEDCLIDGTDKEPDDADEYVGTPKGIPAALLDRNEDGEVCVLYNENTTAPLTTPVLLTENEDIEVKLNTEYHSYYVYNSTDKRACVLFLADGVSLNDAKEYITPGFSIEGAKEHSSHAR